MRELHGIGNNLNQVAQKAHVLNVVDARRYDEAARALDKAVLDITRAVMLPRKPACILPNEQISKDFSVT
jgi:hypothetical protein